MKPYQKYSDRALIPILKDKIKVFINIKKYVYEKKYF